jgi:class 3 adenylate cyclase
MTQNPPTQDRVRDYLQEAEARAVYRILPRHLAQTLSLPYRRVLEALIDGMFEGETVLHWELECPMCGGIGELRSGWLRHASHDQVCPMCGGEFIIHLDDEAHATFSPHPRLRPLTPEERDADFETSLRTSYPPTLAHELLTIQPFADWARHETLPPEEYLEVQRMVVWFSDLTGSTALYARSGDPRAFQLVREHFDVIFEAIQEAEGAVVKTIGDGVMAVFVSEEQAVRAGVGAHERLETFNRKHGLGKGQRLVLKVGVHAGPMIVVTLDERLDYFGTSVNVASRVSHLARGGDLVLTQPVFAGEGVQDLIAGHAVESFSAPLRGLEESVVSYRVQLQEPPAPPTEAPAGWLKSLWRRLGPRRS